MPPGSPWWAYILTMAMAFAIAALVKHAFSRPGKPPHN